MSGPLSPSASSDQRAAARLALGPTPSAVTVMPPRRAPNRASQAAIGRNAGASGLSDASSRKRTAQAASPSSRVRRAGSTLARNSPSSRATAGSMSRSGVSASAASRRPSPGRLTHPAPIHARRVVQAPPLKHRTGWPACESIARVTDRPGDCAAGAITVVARRTSRQPAVSRASAALLSAGVELAAVTASTPRDLASPSSAAAKPAT